MYVHVSTGELRACSSELSWNAIGVAQANSMNSFPFQEESALSSMGPEVASLNRVKMNLTLTEGGSFTRRESNNEGKQAHKRPHSLPYQSFSSYYCLHTLGAGEFGRVKLAIHKDHYHKVAIKFIPTDPPGPMHAKIQNEINILKVSGMEQGLGKVVAKGKRPYDGV